MACSTQYHPPITPLFPAHGCDGSSEDASTHLREDDSMSCVSRFEGSDASSATSLGSRSGRSSPAPSVMSITSTDLAQAFKQQHGRVLNAISEVYSLPADEQEFERLDRQHRMFIEIMGRYPPPLPSILAHEEFGPTKSALDVGCGNGSWAIQVASDFPLCNVVALDLIPMQAERMPPNLRSEVDDVNLDMGHYYGEFDVVHARLVGTGIRNYPEFIDQCSLMLRPGGLIDLLEIDYLVYGLDQKPILAPGWNTIEAPYLPRWSHYLENAIRARGGTAPASHLLEGLIYNHPKFMDMTYHCYWVPIAPWHYRIAGLNLSDSEVQRQMRIATMMRDDMLELLQSARPLLLNSGLEPELVSELEEGSRRELTEALYPAYFCIRTVHARRAP